MTLSPDVLSQVFKNANSINVNGTHVNSEDFVSFESEITNPTHSTTNGFVHPVGKPRKDSLMNIMVQFWYLHEKRLKCFGHEVIPIDATSNYAELRSTVGNRFKQICNGDAAARANLDDIAFLRKDLHHIQKIKAVGGISPLGEWDENFCNNIHTTLTAENCEDVLAMIKDRRTYEALSVTLTVDQ